MAGFSRFYIIFVAGGNLNCFVLIACKLINLYFAYV